MEWLVNIHKKLQIPYTRHFYNLPLSHYENLIESIGRENVNACIRELIVHHREDKVLSEKARILKRKLNKKYLNENMNEEKECECGFKSMGEEYRECPICLKSLFTESKKCYYMNNDKSCSLDGEDCNFTSEHDCGKN